MPLLSSLVFLGVIHCSHCCEWHHCLHHDSSASKTTALLPPPLLLLRSDHILHHQKVISSICSSVKNRLHRTFHAPPHVAIILGIKITRHHVLPILFMRHHALPRAKTWSVDVIDYATSALMTSSSHVITTYISNMLACLHQHSINDYIITLTSSPLTFS